MKLYMWKLSITMGRFISGILLVVFMSFAWYAVYPNKARLRAIARMVKRQAAPCATTITYSLGSIDPRFDITAETLSEDLKKAETVWEGPARRDLFEYAERGGDITVNLIYDIRQAAAGKLKKMDIRTDQGRASYEAIRARYNDLSALVDSEQAKNAARLAAYKRRDAAFTDEMRRWTYGGSAAQLRRLKAVNAALERELSDMSESEKAVKAHINTLNALATMLNQLIVQLNLNIAQYNRVGAALGSVESGSYRAYWGMQEIDIYSYTDSIQLAGLLAHEMGHALGIEHLSSPEAVMYKIINSSGDLKAADMDISALDTICRSGFFKHK